MGTSLWVPGLKTHLSAAGLARAAKYRACALALLFGMDRFALRQFWLKHFGCTPKEWLMAERDRAAESLLGSRDELRRIARQLFYRDGAHFTRVFKQRHHGRTPRAWREKRFWEEHDRYRAELRVHWEGMRRGGEEAFACGQYG